MLSDLELLTLQTETLFVQNEAKRLLYTNEPDKPEAPRFFLGRTKQGHLCRFRDDVPGAIVRQLEEVVAKEADGLENPLYLGAYKDLLRQYGPIQSVWTGPAYRFPNMVQPSTDVVTIDETNVELLNEHFADWKDVLPYQPCVAVVEKDNAVSICCSSRTSPQAAEAGLETAPTFRGRGYAVKVVSSWAAAVAKTGRIPLYSTSWDNEASRAVAKKLGLIMYATDLHFT